MIPDAALVAELKTRAAALGFDAFGIARTDARPDLPEKLAHALAEGWHADMDWMEETAERRGDPRRLWTEARSAILLGVNYGPETNPWICWTIGGSASSPPMPATAIITTSSRGASRSSRGSLPGAPARM